MPQHHDPDPTDASRPTAPDAEEKSVDKACESVAGEEDPGAADDPTSQSSALKPPAIPEPDTGPHPPARPPA